MVRILREEKPIPTNYTENVTIGMMKDDETDDVHLAIVVNKKVDLSSIVSPF